MNSSRMSNKSEKNLGDFDGEDMMSDEELALINTRASSTNHELLQHQLAHMASLYGNTVVTGGTKHGAHMASPRGK